jgi:hypothetical protein
LLPFLHHFSLRQARTIRIAQASLMRGMLSVAESEVPSLFILVPPDMVHVFPSSEDQFDWQTKQEMKACEVYFLCIVCQLTGKVMHKPVKLRFPGAKAMALLKKAAGPMKVAFALLKLGMVAAKVAGGGCLPCPDSFPLSIDEIAEMGETFEAMAEKTANVIAFIDVAVEDAELGKEVSILPSILPLPVLLLSSHPACAQSGQQKLNKLEQLTALLRVAEEQAGVKSSRLLRKLLKLSTDSKVKDLTKTGIADLAKLYRCVHKAAGKVVWISADDDSQQRAHELGFLAPELRAVESDVSDVEDEELGDTGAHLEGTDDISCGAPAAYAKEGATATGTTNVSRKPTSSASNAVKGQKMPLTADVQDLKRRLSSLDENVAGLGTTVLTLAAKKSTAVESLQRAPLRTSATCTLL